MVEFGYRDRTRLLLNHSTQLDVSISTAIVSREGRNFSITPSRSRSPATPRLKARLRSNQEPFEASSADAELGREANSRSWTQPRVDIELLPRKQTCT